MAAQENGVSPSAAHHTHVEAHAGEDREIDQLASLFWLCGLASSGRTSGLSWPSLGGESGGDIWVVRLEMQPLALDLAALGWRSSPYARRIS